MRPNSNTGRHGTKTGKKTTLRIHSEKRIKSCGRYLERKKFCLSLHYKNRPMLCSSNG